MSFCISSSSSSSFYISVLLFSYCCSIILLSTNEIILVSLDAIWSCFLVCCTSVFKLCVFWLHNTYELCISKTTKYKDVKKDLIDKMFWLI